MPLPAAEDAGTPIKVLMVVRPQRADILCQRLLERGWIDSLSAEESRGYGRQKGHLDSYSTVSDYAIDFLPKVAVSGIIERGRLDELIDVVCTTCRTGRIGDGKIFVLGTVHCLTIGAAAGSEAGTEA
jgi:nitrogen regulatory protein P-II 1